MDSETTEQPTRIVWFPVPWLIAGVLDTVILGTVLAGIPGDCGPDLFAASLFCLFTVGLPLVLGTVLVGAIGTFVATRWPQRSLALAVATVVVSVAAFVIDMLLPHAFGAGCRIDF